jgi:hypothetical protein
VTEINIYSFFYMKKQVVFCLYEVTYVMSLF